MEPIRGDWEGSYGSAPPDSLSAHCHACGGAYPWTQAKLDAFKELADAVDELSNFERETLEELLPHLVQETPRTQPAGFKVTTIVNKLAGPGKAALKRLLDELATEAAKKALGL